MYFRSEPNGNTNNHTSCRNQWTPTPLRYTRLLKELLTAISTYFSVFRGLRRFTYGYQSSFGRENEYPCELSRFPCKKALCLCLMGSYWISLQASSSFLRLDGSIFSGLDFFFQRRFKKRCLFGVNDGDLSMPSVLPFTARVWNRIRSETQIVISCLGFICFCVVNTGDVGLMNTVTFNPHFTSWVDFLWPDVFIFGSSMNCARFDWHGLKLFAPVVGRIRVTHDTTPLSEHKNGAFSTQPRNGYNAQL